MCWSKECKCGCRDVLNALLHLLGIIWLIYGLWVHSWGWIVAGIIACAVGHLQFWWREKGKVKEKPVEKQPAKKRRR